jgi:hypothetical protein
MKTVATQFGTAASADFEERTWTFEMPENFKVWAGEFAIVDKMVYDELLEALKLWQAANALGDNQLLMEARIKRNSAIKKATE